MAKLQPLRFATHSKLVQAIAIQHGWLPAARYTNLRDVKTFQSLGFLDINWKNYDFERHLEAVQKTRPHLTIARDWERPEQLDEIVAQATILSRYAEHVAIVPKVKCLSSEIEDLIPSNFLFAFSTPTKYGGTNICPSYFKRPTHVLGGRPQDQLSLRKSLNVYSFDCNRFTIDAAFGDYFDGTKFRPHPIGGYSRCIEDSIKNINLAWEVG